MPKPSDLKLRPPAADAAGLPPVPDEVRPAVGDIAYNLTRNLADTGEDLRDAFDVLPLAIAKRLHALAGLVRSHPARAAGLLVATAGLIGWVVAQRRKPR
jgi:hypothetical protein